MAYLINIGSQFKLAEDIEPDGSIIIANTLPMHKLQRRPGFFEKYGHLQNRLFDPQLYMAGVDANTIPKVCAYLASYPWFGVSGLVEYDSGIQKQSQWKKDAEEKISKLWPKQPPTDPKTISEAVRECIDMQLQLGCAAIILPSPLTSDRGTSYDEELLWLDSALDYIRSIGGVDIPVLATIAIQDLCIRYSDPKNNQLLDLVSDTVSAREIDGVYIVIEQGSEPDIAKHCSNTRTLWSLLHLVHLFSQDSGLHVAVNFVGFFGLFCRAVGAAMWSTGWYKSRYRFRIADKIGGGFARPSYWSSPAVCDIHLKKDLDKLVKGGLLNEIAVNTGAAAGLLGAIAKGNLVENVPSWVYRPGNVTAARQHFLQAAVMAERDLVMMPTSEWVDAAEEWLSEAAKYAGNIAQVLGPGFMTNIDHVQAWHDAFRAYRADHNV